MQILAKKYFKYLQSEKEDDIKSCYLSTEDLSERFGFSFLGEESEKKNYNLYLNMMISDAKEILERTALMGVQNRKFFLTQVIPVRYSIDGREVVIPAEELPTLQFIPSLVITFQWGHGLSESLTQSALITGPLLKTKEGWKFAGKFRIPFLKDHLPFLSSLFDPQREGMGLFE